MRVRRGVVGRNYNIKKKKKKKKSNLRIRPLLLLLRSLYYCAQTCAMNFKLSSSGTGEMGFSGKSRVRKRPVREEVVL